MKKIVFIVLGLLAFASCKTSKTDTTTDKVTEITDSPNTELSTIDISNMSNEIKPQDDFFLYSNENWIKNNPIPPSESRWGSFNELEKNNQTKLIQLLSDLADKQEKKGTDAQLLGDYFMSYLDVEKRQEAGLLLVKKDLEKINSMKSKSEMVSILAQQHINGISGMFSFGVGQDLKNVDKNISYLSQGGISLPNKEYYTKPEKQTILTAYQKYMFELMMMYGKDASSASSSIEYVLEIEKTLAESMYAPAEMRAPEKTYNKKSLEETKKLFGNFDFEKYLVEIGSTSFDTLIVGNPEFISTLSKLIDSQKIEAWKDYLSWHVMNRYAKHLGESFIQKRFDFYGGVLSGKKEMKPLKESVIDEITDMEFGELLGKAFVEKHFSANASKRVNEMVDNLLIVFRERIENLDWMSTETKAEALNKLNSIGRKLGYPSKWEDYSALNFTRENYLQNVIEANRFSHYKNLSELNKPVDKDKWGMPAHMVNAYYHPLLNEIAFPAGIMQPPFFDEKAEDAVNYGRIGMVIGHEFTHGFDDMGSKFAADGSFKNWWSESDRKLFEEKTTLLGETFSGFCPIEGHCVNPQLTMGENIADLGGLTMAYYAYARTAEFKSNEKKEGFLPAQRFFIAYAQLWKINYTPEEMKNRIANDSHSPGMYRVNGPLMNCPEFFDAFNVKEGDKMRNSEKKIAKIW
jgi:putative endopeptidase